jgi:hypothetical protein
MARAMGILVKDHLIAVNAERSRSGRNWYARAARSVTTRAAGGFALVSVTQIGMRLRYYGGTVRAGKNISTVTGKLTRFLTIPASPETAGMRAGEFNDLDVALVMNPSGRLQWALVRRASSAISIVRRKRSDGTVKTAVRPGMLRAGGTVMFWLVRKATYRADPSVLPTKDEMVTTAVTAAERRIQRLTDRANQGAN